MKQWMAGCLAAMLSASALAQSSPDSVQPPPHTVPWPDIGISLPDGRTGATVILGPELQRGVPARAMLEDRRRLDRALAKIQPQRPGTVDAYVVSVALDSDPVFGREAREAGRVLARRYAAEDRTITLAGPDGHSADLPHGSLTSLAVTLAHVAELMDTREDVLILYSTSHGAPMGLAYHYGDTGYGVLSPVRLKGLLEEVGIRRRMVMLSACFSGVFVPFISGPDTVIVTAAAADRSSFGCLAENDWTFFGDALINNALRKPEPLADLVGEARETINRWERGEKLQPSMPQMVFGANVPTWLSQLEARVPQQATSPVGRPSVSSFKR